GAWIAAETFSYQTSIRFRRNVFNTRRQAAAMTGMAALIGWSRANAPRNQRRYEMTKMIFVNLPVTDLPRAKAFYEALGFTHNAQFSDDNSACMVWSET